MNKITNSEIQKYHVQSVTGNRLTGTVEQNKRVFDNFPQFVADRINEIIDELTGTGGAGSISTTDGTLQSVLDSYLASINDRYTKDATNTLVTAETKDLVKSVAVDINTGVITVTKKDGTATTIDTAIEKIPATFSLENDDATGKASLVVTNQDGSVTKTDVSNLLNHYTFENTGLINFTAVKSADGYHITAVVNDASVGMAQLNAEVTDYINGVKASVSLSEANAKTSETNAKTSETNASASASKAQSYAVGGTGTRTGEDSDNAKYYAEQASASASSAESSASSATSSATSAATSAASAEKAYQDVKDIAQLNAEVTDYINGVKAAVSLSEANAKTSETNAKTSETNAKTSETNASASASKSQSYAVGGTGTRTGEDSDNAKYYAEQASNSASSAESSASSATSSATSAATSAASAEKAYQDVKDIAALADIAEIKSRLDGKANHKYNQNASVLGVTKTTEQIGDEQAVFKKGGIFGGTSAEAGLVTRGICGITSPDENGGCTKENLYINFDGGTEYKSDRQMVLQAGSVGANYGHNLYQYAAARGDAVKGYVDNAKAEVDTAVNGKVSKSGDTMTGKLTAPKIETGTDEASYFQSKKFRGEGDASTYYHAVDFGYANHDMVDFHEYGGVWNFYQNTGGKSNTGSLVASIKPDGVHAPLKGNADTATSATSATNDSDGNAINTTYRKISDSYSKSETDTKLTGKADKATSLSGYGITDGVTTSGLNTAINGFKRITWSTITIATSAWSNKTATVSVAGVTTNNAVDVAPAESTYDAYTSAGIRATKQGAGKLTFVCKTVPTVAISVNVKVYN